MGPYSNILFIISLFLLNFLANSLTFSPDALTDCKNKCFKQFKPPIPSNALYDECMKNCVSTHPVISVFFT